MIEFWYEFGSNYSYLAVMRIDALARQYGVTVLWRPFLLGPIFKSLGWDNSPFVLQKEKGAYVWKDMERQCAKYGLPFKRPSVFPRNAVLAMRVALLGVGAPWLSAYNQRIMQLNFAEDRDIADPALIAAVLTDLGLPAAGLIEAAEGDDNRARLRAQVERARQLGIFGAPTFFVGDEMFWGNDRLEDALIFASGDQHCLS